MFSGVHHKKSNCGASLVMDKVKSIVLTARQFFFPDRSERELLKELIPPVHF